MADALVDLRRTFPAVVMVGIVSGLVGVAFLWAMKLVSSLLGPDGRWVDKLDSVFGAGIWKSQDLMHLGLMVFIGLVVAILVKLLGNPGDVELLVDNIHVLGGSKSLTNLRSLIPVSLLCIGTGGAMGPEAPMVQTTGSLGTYLAQHFKLGVPERRILTITGMAAGFTVLFGAPLGSAVFALEILHRRGLEYYEALLPAVIGSLCGYALYIVASHSLLAPVWHFPSSGNARAIDLAWALAAGVAGAIVAGIFTYGNKVLGRFFAKMPAMSRPVIGGLILGLLALWSPYALTFGEAQVNVLIPANATVLLLITAAAAKLIGTSVTLSSGWKGGFIIPMFFIGVSLGRLWHLELPYTNEVVMMAAMMAAINTGVTKTPIGSTLVVTAMAGLHLLPTTLLAAVVALLLSSSVGMIHTQRARINVSAEDEEDADSAAPDNPAEAHASTRIAKEAGPRLADLWARG